MSRLVLRPQWGPAIALLAVAALTLRLGFWQLDRAEQKRVLGERHAALAREPAVTLPAVIGDADDYRYRRVEATGRYLGEHGIFLDNRTLHGVAGYHLLTPLRVEGSGGIVLVNRGWVAAGPDRTVLPEVPVPSGSVRVEGIAVLPGRALELSSDTVQGRVWQNLDLDRYRQSTGLDVLPVVVQQEGGPKDGLVRQWELPSTGREKNLAYAVQWFAMAAGAAGALIWLSIKRVAD